MCGIFGFVTRSAEAASRIDADAAQAALAHRGPDGAGRFSGVAGDARCTLVHTRLAIIDLSEGGKQPMASHDGRYEIVFNGEIYNHAEVRQELERAGVTFRSTSDTEVLLEAYAQWGTDALERLRGMFAFAIWDARQGTLFLARDRLGIKPLYLAELPGGGLAFASEVRALLAAGAAARRLSPAGLRSYLRWGSVAEPLTILDGVRTLLPGHHGTWSAGSLREQAYWSLSAAPTVPRSLAEAAEGVRPILREAVRLRLVSDVPVGVFLSGGIDSSVIAALAAEASTDLRTFTVAFDERELSEGEHAASLARHLGCRHETLLLRHDEARRELDTAVGALDQPSADGINTYFVSRAVRDAGIKVALSGLGGDEVFAGYHYFRQFRAALGIARRVPAPVGRALAAAQGRGWLDRFGARGAKLAALGSARDAGDVYGALRCMFTASQVDALLGGRPEEAAPDGATVPPAMLEALERGDIEPLNALSVLELSNYLRNTLLRDTDAVSMAHALEVRVPLIDHRLVEAVLPLASAVKVAGATNKPLLVAAAPRLPTSVTNRKKQGFVLPFEAWFRGPLRAEVRHELLDGGLGAALSRPVLEETWGQFAAGRLSASRIWSLAALSSWLDKHRVLP